MGPKDCLQFPETETKKLIFLKENKEKLLNSGGCLIVLRNNQSHTVAVLEIIKDRIYFAHEEEICRYESLKEIPRTKSFYAGSIDRIHINADTDDNK